MDAEALKKAVEEEEKKIADAEEAFKAVVSELQEKYSKLSEEKDKTIGEVKAGGLGLMKSVSKFQESSKEEEKKDEL